jgi:aryl-alcohol dehydrogenase-like predicted oxidoreductase
MEYLDLGRTGIRVSRIGLGTWAVGSWMWGGAGDEASMATIREALERGITLIDTSPTYGRGHAEEIVGRALAGRRDEAVIATKAGIVFDGDGAMTLDTTPARLVKQAEDSLRRLRTDRIDIYQLEGTDRVTPIEETAEAMGRLLAAGKIGAIGAVNLSVAQMAAFRSVAPLHTIAPLFNVFEREAERDLLPYAARHGIVPLTHCALCRGLLSGLLSPRDEKAYLRAVRELETLARERFGKRVAHLALRWVLDQPGVGVSLWRARRPDQLTRAIEALDFRLDVQTLRDVDDIVRRALRRLDTKSARPSVVSGDVIAGTLPMTHETRNAC